MIVAVFGKKGSGKTTLSKQYMMKAGGRVLFFSPVENIGLKHTEVWDLKSIPDLMEKQRPGEILLIRLVDIDALDVACAQAIYLFDAAYNRAGYKIIIDEMDKYTRSRQLVDCIHYARHFNIDIIANTRRYADMPRLLTSQADELCIYATQEPIDLDYLRRFAGREFVDRVPGLPQYHYLHYPTGQVLKANYYGI